MRMRKYSMTGQRVAQLKRLLRNDRIQVSRINVAAHDKREDCVYVFFDYAVEESAKDRETLKRLKEKAIEVAEDKVYQKLSNSKQRELFLLDHYNLSKRDSGDVMELVKMIEIEASVAREEIANAELSNMEKESKKDEYAEKG